MNRKTIFDVIQIASFCTVLFAVAAANAAMPKDKAISVEENRTLQRLPELSLATVVSGQYMRSFERFIADQFPYRDTLAAWGKAVTAMHGFPDADGASIVIQSGAGNNAGGTLKGSASVAVSAAAQTALADPTASTASANLATETASVEPPAGEVSNASGDAPGAAPGKYLVLKDRAFMLFEADQRAGESYARALRGLRNSLPDSVKLYAMLVPSQAEFAENAKHRALSDSQKEAIGRIHAKLGNGIEAVDAYSELQRRASAGEYVYFRTDHHWTALGAYYAYAQFAKQLGEAAVPLTEYTQGELKGYLGSAYAATANAALKRNPDSIIYYKPNRTHEYMLHWDDDVPLPRNVIDPAYASNGGAYAIFLEGDSPWGVIRTKASTGRTIAVIKDSYGNPFVPFLIPHFDEIYFVDKRYYEGDLTAFLKAKRVNHVLILNGTVTANSEGYADLLSVGR